VDSVGTCLDTTGLLVNGDGCDSDCNVETGWYCINGDHFTADGCYEICNDGLDFHYYACDDGNFLPLDGCRADCTVETIFKCEQGNPSRPDACF
jgi:cysteine-rich repeat protein